MRSILVLALLLFPVAALAQDVPLPRPRPDPSIRAATPPPAEPEKPGAEKPEASKASPRIFQVACPAVVSGSVAASVVPPIAEGQCGERSPLALEAILANGRMVPVTGEPTVNCQLASALPAWVSAIDGYVAAHDKTRIAAVNVGTSYMCRDRRTGAADTDLSEHAFANALDVVGFTLEDGRTVTVESGWNGADADGRSIVRFAHDAACTSFMTVLGPEANALHHDHLHIDFGCHGKTCTARLCE